MGLSHLKKMAQDGVIHGMPDFLKVMNVDGIPAYGHCGMHGMRRIDRAAAVGKWEGGLVRSYLRIIAFLSTRARRFSSIWARRQRGGGGNNVVLPAILNSKC